MMKPEEIEWLNEYHKQVYEELSPLLKEEDRVWLQQKTLPLTPPIKGGE
jgi:Xaa-Pro aminopeptidase